MLKVVSNTTPIISLLKIDKLLLLNEIYGSIIIPEAVLEEIEKGKSKDFYIDIRQLSWIEVNRATHPKDLSGLQHLDAGERETILLADMISADLVIIDEAAGRKAAKATGLKVTGTLGVLIKAKTMGKIHAVAPLLDKLQERGIWLGEKLIAMILKKAGEA